MMRVYKETTNMKPFFAQKIMTTIPNKDHLPTNAQIETFLNTPIHRFFNIRGIPGLSNVNRDAFREYGIMNPMDFIRFVRTLYSYALRMSNRNKYRKSVVLCMRNRVRVVCSFISLFGQEIGSEDVFLASVAIVQAERIVPREQCIYL